MPDENPTTPPVDAPPAPPAGDTPPAAPPADPPAPPAEKEKEEELPPDVLRKKLTEANAEAANYRLKLREAEAKLASAKTVEEFEAAKVELSTKVAELERQVLVSQVASKHELPSELAEVLQGSTPEELEAHAKKLAKFAAVEPRSLKGGLDPDGDEGEFDPVAEARKARRRY